MLLVNPHTGKLVDVSDEFVDQLSRAGFKKQEPEAVEPEKVSAPRARRSRTSSK
jgi:ribosomal protein S9